MTLLLIGLVYYRIDRVIIMLSLALFEEMFVEQCVHASRPHNFPDTDTNAQATFKGLITATLRFFFLAEG
jgi:hypothetical protein